MSELVRAWRAGMPVPDWLPRDIEIVARASGEWILLYPDGRMAAMHERLFLAQYEPTETTEMPSDYGRTALPGHTVNPRRGAPGVKTSEFWVMLAGAGLVVAQEFGLDMDAEQTLALVGVVASYILNRAWVKR